MEAVLDFLQKTEVVKMNSAEAQGDDGAEEQEDEEWWD
jgi:hypothetical protein